jgi:hypothetical protein
MKMIPSATAITLTTEERAVLEALSRSFPTTTTQLASQRLQGSWSARKLPVLTHFPPLARICKRNRHRILVHVQPNVGDKLFHDPSPMHEARHRPSGATLVNLHIVRRVAPISGEHLV